MSIFRKNQQALTLEVGDLTNLSTFIDFQAYAHNKLPMRKSDETREKLLIQARMLTWERGYSNVSLREIAQGAGVDVALISRYFGGKRGLFEATLEAAFGVEEMPTLTRETLVDFVVHVMTTTPREHDMPTMFQLILINAHDAEVGAAVQAAHIDQVQSLLDEAIGDKAQAALFMAALLGMVVAEKSLHLQGIAPYDTDLYEAQLRHTLTAALEFRAT